MSTSDTSRKKGWHISDEHKKRISEANKGKHLSEETRKKLSLANIGKLSPFKGQHHSAESKRKLSLNHKGKPSKNKGKKILKISENNKKRWADPEFKKRVSKSISNATKGRVLSAETRKKISVSNTGKHVHSDKWKKVLSEKWSKEKNPAWKGGVSFEKYGPEFTKKLKDYIIKRDIFTCQICNTPYQRSDLAVHHIDYNKKNNNKNNLVCVCNTCHSKTNFNRDRWILYFSEKRTFLPNFADLIDRLCISQMKAIFIPEHTEEYKKEVSDISHDIDVLIKEKNIQLTGKMVWAVLVIQLANRWIWENESKARAGGHEQDKLLSATHTINGVRNTAKNIISQELGERIDLKVDCLAADFAKEFGNWDLFK